MQQPSPQPWLLLPWEKVHTLNEVDAVSAAAAVVEANSVLLLLSVEYGISVAANSNDFWPPYVLCKMKAINCNME